MVARARDAVFDPVFIEDLIQFIAQDKKTALRLLELVQSVLRDPFSGIGKPEPLKRMGADVWSRRLTGEHRLVYHVRHERIYFLQARYHY